MVRSRMQSKDLEERPYDQLHGMQSLQLQPVEHSWYMQKVLKIHAGMQEPERYNGMYEPKTQIHPLQRL